MVPKPVLILFARLFVEITPTTTTALAVFIVFLKQMSNVFLKKSALNSMKNAKAKHRLSPWQLSYVAVFRLHRLAFICMTSSDNRRPRSPKGHDCTLRTRTEIRNCSGV